MDTEKVVETRTNFIIFFSKEKEQKSSVVLEADSLPSKQLKKKWQSGSYNFMRLF